MKEIWDTFKTLVVYTILCVSTFLMMRTIVNYGTFETDIQFLAFKQEYLSIDIWKVSFYVHVFSAVVALLAGFTQFSNPILRNHRRLHRALGYVYIVDILLINFPAALVMGVYSNGGLQGKVAFLLLDCLWFGFTYQAVRYAMARDFKTHREFMIRSYSMTFSAITLRTWKIVLLHTSLRDSLHFYVVEAWLGFVPNLMVAELLIRFPSWFRLAAKNHHVSHQ